MPLPIPCPACGAMNFVTEDAGQVCTACQAALDGGFGNPPSIAVATDAADNPYAASHSASGTQASLPSGSDELANRSTRLASQAIDSFFFALVLIGVWAAAMPEPVQQGARREVAGESMSRDEARALLAGVYFAAVGATLLIQSPLMAIRGQTIGKALFGIQVANLRDEGIPDTYRGVILRLWFQALLGVIPGYAVLDALCIFGQDRRCLHDHIAATRVIQRRKADDPVAKMRAERKAGAARWS
jgi:uncharacterized RDD family membrane protein YckC